MELASISHVYHIFGSTMIPLIEPKIAANIKIQRYIRAIYQLLLFLFFIIKKQSNIKLQREENLCFWELNPQEKGYYIGLTLIELYSSVFIFC